MSPAFSRAPPPTTIGGTTFDSGASGIFISKLTTYGTFLWTTAILGAKTGIAPIQTALKVTPAGDIYLAAEMEAGDVPVTVAFGPKTMTLTKSRLFVTELDTNGNFLWVDQLVGAPGGDDRISGLATDSASDVYVGFASGLLTKLDSNQNVLWTRNIGGLRGPDPEGIDGIGVDSSGNVYVAGVFSDTASFGNSDLTPMTAFDKFVTKLDSAGNFVWARDLGADSTIQETGEAFPHPLYGFAVDSSDNVYVAGNFTGTVNFDPGIGVFSLTGPAAASNNSAFFLEKLTPNMVQGTAVNAQNEPLAGVAVNLYGSRDTTIGNGDDVLLGSTQTDSQGHYQFVSPGDALHYYIVFGTRSAMPSPPSRRQPASIAPARPSCSLCPRARR